MIMIVILCLKIFYHALANDGKNNECIYYVMKFPFFPLYGIDYYAYAQH